MALLIGEEGIGRKTRKVAFKVNWKTRVAGKLAANIKH